MTRLATLLAALHLIVFGLTLGFIAGFLAIYLLAPRGAFAFLIFQEEMRRIARFWQAVAFNTGCAVAAAGGIAALVLAVRRRIGVASLARAGAAPERASGLLLGWAGAALLVSFVCALVFVVAERDRINIPRDVSLYAIMAAIFVPPMLLGLFHLHVRMTASPRAAEVQEPAP